MNKKIVKNNILVLMVTRYRVYLYSLNQLLSNHPKSYIYPISFDKIFLMYMSFFVKYLIRKWHVKRCLVLYILPSRMSPCQLYIRPQCYCIDSLTIPGYTFNLALCYHGYVLFLVLLEAFVLNAYYKEIKSVQND